MKLLDVITAPWAIQPANLLEKRSLSKAAGHTHYFTGKPCPQGHVAPRRVINGGCQVCLYGRSAVWRAANTEKAIAATANWRSANRSDLLASRRAYRRTNEGRANLKAQRAAQYAANPEKHRQRGRDFYHANTEVCAQLHRDYRLSIPGFDRERGAKRRADLLQAMPKWADRSAIRFIYAHCPAGMQVDHFVPLRGVLPGGRHIRGLHVPANLRYLNSQANAARGNRLTPADVQEIERAYEAT